MIYQAYLLAERRKKCLHSEMKYEPSVGNIGGAKSKIGALNLIPVVEFGRRKIVGEQKEMNLQLGIFSNPAKYAVTSV